MICRRRQLRANGEAAQVYFPKTFVTDSAFPIRKGDDVFVHPTDCGRALVMAPIEVLGDYPITASDVPVDQLSTVEQQQILNGESPEQTP